MVCPIGSGRMAVIARLLEAESFSQTITEEVSHQKLAAQYFYRELHEADEANLLDEEDMHVFGLRPMADPLQLVCCNACKKPVKTSQYVAHSELCRSLHSIGDTILEVESVTSRKKPPRKERKKLLTAHAHPQQARSGEHSRRELVNANETAGLESRLETQIGVKSSSAMEAKESRLETQIGMKSSSAVEAKVSARITYMADCFEMSPGNTDYLDRLMPSAKRSKPPKAGKCLPLSNDPESYGVTKRMNNQEAYTCRGFIKETVYVSQRPMNKCGHFYNEHGELYTCCISLKDVPVPLATKTYYSQRSNRLRSALTNLYCKASAKELCTDAPSSKISQERTTSLQSSSRNGSSFEETDDLHMKGDETQFQDPDFVLPRTFGRSPDVTSFPDEVPVDGISRPDLAAVGLIGSKYLLNPYSFSVNSGKALGVQQPNGGVPVT